MTVAFVHIIVYLICFINMCLYYFGNTVFWSHANKVYLNYSAVMYSIINLIKRTCA